MGEMPFNPKTAVRRLGDVPRQGPEHPFPKIRLVPEQEVSKAPVRAAIAPQQSRTVESVRAELSHQAIAPVVPTEKEKRTQRLEELNHEIDSSYIEVGTVTSERSELRSRKDLSKSPFLKHILPFSRTRTDVVSLDHEDGSRTEYVDRKPRQILFWIANAKPGVYEETYTRDEKGALHLAGRKRIGEHLYYKREENPENPKEAKRSYIISTERTRELEREKDNLLGEVRREALRERMGDLGAILDGRAIKSAETPAQKREFNMLRMQLNAQINQVYAKSKHKQVAQPERYTQLSFGDRVRYTGQTIKELILPNNWKSVGSIALGAGTIGSIDALFLPVSPVVKKIAGLLLTGRSMAVGWLMSSKREKIAQEKQAIAFQLADNFRELQRQREGKPLVEQAKEFREMLYRGLNRDRYEQLKFRKPELSEDELWKRLKRSGFTKEVVTKILPTVTTVAAFGLLGYAGVVGIADLIFHVGWSPLGFLPFYSELGNLLHAPAGFGVAYGATAYSLLMQAHNMLARIPDALTTARKKVQLGREKREAK